MNFQLGERAHYQPERWQLLQYIFIPLNSSQPSPRRARLAVGERSLLINLVLSIAGETEPELADKILQELTEDGRLGVARQKAALDFSRRGTIILPPCYASIPRPVWHLPAPACLFHLSFIPPCPFFTPLPFFSPGGYLICCIPRFPFHEQKKKKKKNLHLSFLFLSFALISFSKILRFAGGKKKGGGRKRTGWKMLKEAGDESGFYSQEGGCRKE